MKMTSTPRDYDRLFQQFWPIYESRPIKNNVGGCELPQLFGLWVFLTEERPTNIIESGAWKGQTTWLFHSTCRDADIVSIDPVVANRQWTAPDRVEYSEIDFIYHNWSAVNYDQALVFFDDHVNEYKRLMNCRSWRFKRIVFEDNYPARAGDPSIRQMLAGEPCGIHKPTLKNRIKKFMRSYAARFDDYAERYDSAVLQQALAAIPGSYEEFPPLVQAELTRWGIPWAVAYPEVKPCLDLALLTERQLGRVLATAKDYTSICRILLD